MAHLAEKRRIGLLGVFDFDYLPADILLRVTVDELHRRLGCDIEIEVLAPYGDAVRRRWPSYRPTSALGSYSPTRADRIASRVDAVVLAPGADILLAAASGTYLSRPIGIEPAHAERFLMRGSDLWVERGTPVIDIADVLALEDILALTRRCSDESSLATTADLMVESGDLPAGPIALAVDAADNSEWWPSTLALCDQLGATPVAANSDGSASTVEIDGVVALPMMVDPIRLLSVFSIADLVITDDESIARIADALGVSAADTPTVTEVLSNDSIPEPSTTHSSREQRHEVDLAFDRISAMIGGAIDASTRPPQPAATDPDALLERIDDLEAINRSLHARLGVERSLIGQRFAEQHRSVVELTAEVRQGAAEVEDLEAEATELRWRLVASTEAIRDLQLTREPTTTRSRPRVLRAIRHPFRALRYVLRKFRRAGR